MSVADDIVKLATAAVEQRRYAEHAKTDVFAFFLSDCVDYFETLGKDMSRDDVQHILETDRRLKHHALFGAEPSPSQKSIQIMEAGVSPSKVPPRDTVGRTAFDVLRSVAQALKEAIHERSYLQYSVPSQRHFFHVVTTRYHARADQAVMERLNEFFSHDNAARYPSRPVFLTPFRVNIDHQLADYTMITTLLFQFNSDPAELAERRRREKEANEPKTP